MQKKLNNFEGKKLRSWDFRILQGILCSNYKTLEHKEVKKQSVKSERKSVKNMIKDTKKLASVVDKSHSELSQSVNSMKNVAFLASSMTKPFAIKEYGVEDSYDEDFHEDVTTSQ